MVHFHDSCVEPELPMLVETTSLVKNVLHFLEKWRALSICVLEPLFFFTPEIWTSHSAFPFLSRSHVGDNLESFEECWYFEWFHVMKWQFLYRRKTHHGSDFMVWTGVVALFRSVLEYNWNEQPQLEGLWLIRLLDKYLMLTTCCIHGIGE
jgi:hypothetical protein